MNLDTIKGLCDIFEVVTVRFSELLVLGCLGFLGFLFTGCSKAADIGFDREKSSYAMGLQIGKQLKAEGDDLDIVALEAGITAAYRGTPPQLPEDEIQRRLRDRFAAHVRNSSDKAAQRIQKSEDFLRKNKLRPSVKVTDSGLQYEVLKEGRGVQPQLTDHVTVTFAGTLIDGTPFDGTKEEEPVITLPVRAAIAGWTEGLQMMKVGARFKLYLPPHLAYGSRVRPGIPSHSVLIYDVELLEIVAAESRHNKIKR